jgi:hypothetical protein
MFKITLEPKRLLDMFKKALMNGLSDSAFIRFTPQEAITNVSQGTYGTYGVYQPTYFSEYVCDAMTEIKITKQFIKNLDELYIGSEQSVTIESDIPNNKLQLVAGGKRWTSSIPNPQNIKSVGVAESSIPVTDVEGIGFLPAKRQSTPIHFQTKIGRERLVIPNFPDVSISVLDTSMKLEWEMDGHAEMNMNLDPQKVLVPRNHFETDTPITPEVPFNYQKYNFNVKLLKSLLESFAGEITITMFQKAIFITQQSKDINMMCFLATKKQD